MSSQLGRISRRDVLRIGGGVALAGALPLVAAACGSSSPPSTSNTETLAQKAKAEGGTVTFYSQIADAEPEISKGFTAAYPWAKINVFGGSPGGIVAKFLTEVRAHAGVADVVMAFATNLEEFRQAKAVASVRLPNDAAMPHALQTFVPELHPFYQVIYVMQYNTKLGVKPPKDPYELANSTWANKFVIDLPGNLGAGGTFLASRKQLWGEDKWMTWLKGLKANNMSITASGSSSYSSVLSGDRNVDVDGLQDVLGQAPGAPVAAFFYDDVVISQAFTVQSSLAPHPSMASLFINWLMSEAGQKVIAQTDRVPARIIDDPMSLDRLVPKGVRQLPETNMTDFIKNSQSYLNVFNEFWPS